MLWMCEGPSDRDELDKDCPSNCVAQNKLPYEMLAYDAASFPDDTWILVPYEKHRELFATFPDARG